MENIALVATKDAELTALARNTGAELSVVQGYFTAFVPFFDELGPLLEQAATCRDPDEARRHRLALKGLRVGAEKKRKELKEDSILRGKVIDGAAAIFVLALKPAEDAMDAIEKAEKLRHLTPPAFAEWLVGLARNARMVSKR